MNFFRYRKPADQAPSTTQNRQAPLIIQEIKEQPALPTIQETQEQQTPPPPPAKKQKDDISDFFHIDMYAIFKHTPEFVEKCANRQGQVVDKYILRLSEPELSTFDQIHILTYENGHYDLHFTGNVGELHTEMIDFINYCARSLGPDFMQKKTYAEDEDMRDMRLGVFSRLWPGRVRIENVYFTLSLTLYDVSARCKPD